MQQTYDLVILDIRMPYTIKGTDLLDTLETLGNDTPVIVFSGFPEDLDERHKERVVKILEKPVNLVDFVSCVESVLQSN